MLFEEAAVLIPKNPGWLGGKKEGEGGGLAAEARERRDGISGKRETGREERLGEEGPLTNLKSTPF